MPTLLIAALVVCLPLVYLNTTLDPTQPIRFLILTTALAILSGTLLARLYRGRSNHDWSVLRRLIFPVCGIYVLISAASVLQAINVAMPFTILPKCFCLEYCLYAPPWC